MTGRNYNQLQVKLRLFFRVFERINVDFAFPWLCLCSWLDLTNAHGAIMSSYILGLDVGTTSVKAVLLETVSRSVAASHALPTVSDIIDCSGIKVGRNSFVLQLVNINCAEWACL